MDTKKSVEFVNGVKVWDRVKTTYEPRFLCFKGKPTTIEGVVGRLGLHSVDLVVPHPLGPNELNRDNSLGWPCRIDYNRILDYEVVGNYIEENFPEYLEEKE